MAKMSLMTFWLMMMASLVALRITGLVGDGKFGGGRRPRSRDSQRLVGADVELYNVRLRYAAIYPAIFGLKIDKNGILNKKDCPNEQSFFASH